MRNKRHRKVKVEIAKIKWDKAANEKKKKKEREKKKKRERKREKEKEREIQNYIGHYKRKLI